MKNTPNYQLPYIEGSDLLGSFPNANKQAMEKVDAQLKSVTGTADAANKAAGEAKATAADALQRITDVINLQHGVMNVTIKKGAANSVGNTVDIPKPFKYAPTVLVSLAHAPSGSAKLVARAYTVTASKFYIALYTGDGSPVGEDVTLPVSWLALGN